MFRLVVDDLRSFPFDAQYARTSHAGIAMLKSFHSTGTAVDELWLDHDLGGNDTIMPVVDWLCERCVWDDMMYIGTIVVHTSNPPGAATIERVLRRWYTVVRVDAHAHGGHVAGTASGGTHRSGGPELADA